MVAVLADGGQVCTSDWVEATLIDVAISDSSPAVLFVDEERAALYIEGELVRTGKSDNVTEWLRMQFGVEEGCWTEPWGGQESRNGDALTLSEVFRRRHVVVEMESAATALREQAAELLAQVDTLEGPQASAQPR